MYCLIDTQWVCFKALGQEQHSFCGSNKNLGLLKIKSEQWRIGDVGRGSMKERGRGSMKEREAWEREGVGGVRGAAFVKGPRKMFQNDIAPYAKPSLWREGPHGGAGRAHL